MKAGLPIAGLEALAGPVTADQISRLALFADRLRADSERMSLVSRHELANLGHHILDSAAVLKFRDLPASETADLGSGGGLPGVVLAILRPRARLVLLDSRHSKIVFLKSVTRALGLSNVEIVHSRLEQLVGHRAFSLAVARALGRVDRVLGTCLGLLENGGRLVLYKGPRWSEEADAAARIAQAHGATIERVERVVLPGTDRSTTFVEFQTGPVSRETRRSD